MDVTENEQFYIKAKQYWEKVPATVDGMLGGFSYISHVDAEESIKFLKPILKVLVVYVLCAATLILSILDFIIFVTMQQLCRVLR